MGKESSESAWQQLATATGGVGRAARSAASPSADEVQEVQEDLREVTASAHRLAQFLDTLANRFDSTHPAEPSDAHVALDQAAAAAEDLATCSKAALLAIEDQE